MLKALWKKEWMQLRTLRWVGLGLGIVLPPCTVAMAELSRRGMLPTGSVGSYTVADLFAEPMGRLYLGLAALLTLLSVTHVFAADRGAGTESFLLERPISRRRLWAIKLGVAVVNSVLLAIAVFSLWLMLRELVVSYGFIAWLPIFRENALLALGAMLLALLGGVAAAPMVRGPLQVTLVALLLGILPFMIVAVLLHIAPMANLGRIRLAVVFFPILPLLYLFASYDGECRGEPFGRGRLWRSSRWLVAGVVGIAILFTIAVPISLRAGTTSPWKYFRNGSGIGLRHGGFGTLWWHDESSGRSQFFAAPVEGAALAPDGRSAILDHARAFGGVREQPRMRLLDASGEELHAPIECEDCLGWESMLWQGDSVLTPYGPSVNSIEGFVAIDAKSGKLHRRAFDLTLKFGRIVGQLPDGAMLGRQCGDSMQTFRESISMIDLMGMHDRHRDAIDCQLLRLGDPIEVLARFPTTRWGIWRLADSSTESPRYWPIATGFGVSRFLDLHTGLSLEFADNAIRPFDVSSDRRAIFFEESLQIIGSDGSILHERQISRRGAQVRRSVGGRWLAVWATDGFGTQILDTENYRWTRVDFPVESPAFWMQFGTAHELTLGGRTWTAIYDVVSGEWRTIRGIRPTVD